MRSGKPRHPPDHVGNVCGRISKLRASARQKARMAARDGEDYQRALARHMRAIKTQLRELEDRLERCPPAAPATEARGARKKRGGG